MPYKISILVLLLGLFACAEESEPLNNENLIFTNSYPIGVHQYDYTDPVSGSVYTVYGDSIWRWPDTVSSRPTLAWDKNAPSILSAAIFTSPIEVSGGEIINTRDMVWLWHSGMNTQYADTIQFTEGNAVVNGTEVDDEIPLDTGLYYWAVWGWGKTGVYIYYSSKQYQLYVEN